MNFKHIEYINGKAHCYREEKPKFTAKLTPEYKSEYNALIQTWKDSAEIFEFAEWQEDKIKDFVFEDTMENNPMLTWEKCVNKGIDITSFCEIKPIPCSENGCSDPAQYQKCIENEHCYNPKYYAFFVEPTLEERTFTTSELKSFAMACCLLAVTEKRSIENVVNECYDKNFTRKQK